MIAEKLSKTVVERIMAAARDVVVWDDALPGFGVRVKPSGVRSYIAQYRNRRTGASKRLTIGQHGPLLTFDQAKKQARAILADAMRGEDPVEVRSDEEGPLRYRPRGRLSREACRSEEAPQERPR